jgi:hypothetical protein
MNNIIPSADQEGASRHMYVRGTWFWGSEISGYNGVLDQLGCSNWHTGSNNHGIFCQLRPWPNWEKCGHFWTHFRPRRWPVSASRSARSNHFEKWGYSGENPVHGKPPQEQWRPESGIYQAILLRASP